MRDSEEKKLVDSIILGDDRAFEKLFERYHPVVYSIVHAIVRNRASKENRSYRHGYTQLQEIML